MRNTKKIKSYSEWRASILKKAIAIPLSICLLVYIVANLEHGASLTASLMSTILIVGITVLFTLAISDRRAYEEYKKIKEDENRIN